MSGFHFEDRELKNSTLEIGFPSCAIDDFAKDGGEEFFTEMHCVL